MCISYWQGRSWIFLRCGWSDIWNISSATLAISKPHHHSTLISPFPSRFSYMMMILFFVFSWNKSLTPPIIDLFDGYTEAWCCIISDSWLISRLLRVIAALGYWPSNAILCIRVCSHWLQQSFLSSLSCCQHVIYVCSHSTLCLIIADARHCYLSIINASQAIQSALFSNNTSNDHTSYL